MEIKNLYEVSGFTFKNKKQAEYFISLVEGKDFDGDQLKEIHSGVENNLVVDYADPSYDSYKMEVIKNALIHNVKIDYGFEVPSFKFRNKSINGFEKKVNVIPFLLKYPKLSEEKIDIIIYALALNISNSIINYYINQNFSLDELFEIFKGLGEGFDVSYYAKPEFDYQQMVEIRKGLEQKFNVEIYATPKFTGNKMYEIRAGLENNIDVSIYTKSEFSATQMRQIRYGLENKIDVSIYAKPEYSWEQMEEIRLGLEGGLDVLAYAKPEFSWQQMFQIRLGLSHNLNVSIYAKKEYNSEEMNEIRLSLLSGDFKLKTSTKIKMLIQKIKGN